MQTFIPFYILLCVYLLIFLSKSISINRNLSIFISLFFFAFYLLVIGLRDFDMIGDTRAYLSMLQNIKASLPIEERIEPGFKLLLHFFSLIELSERQFIFFISILQTFIFFIAFKCYLSDSKALLIGSLLFVSMFYFYSFGANILRQGFSIAFLFLFYANLFNNGKLRTSIIYIALAISFHYTSVLPILLALFVKAFGANIRFLILAFFLISILSFFGLIDLFLYSIIGTLIPSYDSYLQDSVKELYRIGFRFDFWIFTFIPVLLYMNLTKVGKFYFKEKIGFYLLISVAFVCAFSIPYSDRIGAYAWAFSSLLMSEFVGSYKNRFLNSYILTVIGITLLGLFSFLFYHGNNFDYSFDLLN